MNEVQVAAGMMTVMDLVSLVASIASLIVAVGAIWLSIVFYKMSSNASNATNEAAKGIDASVQRLEKLFDKLYSDTFSMMKDTVSDMRKHIWNKPSEETGELSQLIKQEIESQVSSVLESSGVKGSNREEIAKRLEDVMENVLKSAKLRKKSVKSEPVLEAIKEHQPISMKKVAEYLDMDFDDLAINHLFPLREMGKITWDGPSARLSHDNLLSINEEVGSS